MAGRGALRVCLPPGLRLRGRPCRCACSRALESLAGLHLQGKSWMAIPS